METNVYEVVLNTLNRTSFFFKTNCPKDKFEEIEKNAEILHSMKTEELDDNYKHYATKCGVGQNKIVYIKLLLADQNYTYEEINVQKVYW